MYVVHYKNGSTVEFDHPHIAACEWARETNQYFDENGKPNYNHLMLLEQKLRDEKTLDNDGEAWAEHRS